MAKPDVSSIPRIQSATDISKNTPKPSIHGTPLPPKVIPRSGK